MITTNYHHLFYFYTIAESCTMTAAAEKLLLNQSTLSVQLRQFERSLGRRLFERRARRLHLTPDGRTVLGYARRIFEAGKELERTLSAGAPAGRRALAVGVMSGTPRSFGHALLRDLRDFKIEAILTDAALRGPDREGLDNRVLASVPIVFAAAPRLAARHSSFPDDAEGAPLLLPSAPSQMYGRILDLISSWTTKPRVIAEVQDLELIRRLALAGEGIAPLNAFTFAQSLPRGGLAIVGKRRDWGLRESVYLVTREHARLDGLIGILKDEFRAS
jgi:LysR family transcriptional regulator, transcriptional activator of nhaA